MNKWEKSLHSFPLCCHCKKCFWRMLILLLSKNVGQISSDTPYLQHWTYQGRLWKIKSNSIGGLKHLPDHFVFHNSNEETSIKHNLCKESYQKMILLESSNMKNGCEGFLVWSQLSLFFLLEGNQITITFLIFGCFNRK